MKSIILSGLLLFIVTIGCAQSAKSSMKAGEKFIVSENYEDAIDQFTTAIEMDPSLAEAYSFRGDAYMAMERLELAKSDYERAGQLDSKESDYIFKAGKVYYQLHEYQGAVNAIRMGLINDDDNLEAYNILVISLINLNRMSEAFIESEKAVSIKRNSATYTNRAMVYFLQKNYGNAINDFQSAVKCDKNNRIALIGLARSQYANGDFTQALGVVNSVLNKFPDDKEAYVIRAQIYADSKEYVNAINDLSKVIMIYAHDADIWTAYLNRGIYKMDFMQHLSAVTDFDKALSYQPNNVDALYYRSCCYEDLMQKDKAAIGFEAYLVVATPLPYESQRIIGMEARIRNLRFESDKPEVVVYEPISDGIGNIQVLKSSDAVTIKGKVKDASEIKEIKLNGVPFETLTGTFDKKSKEFEFQISLIDKDELIFEVTDVYENMIVSTFGISVVEADAPTINIFDPPTTDLGEMYLQSESNSVTIQGQIDDESRIKSIYVDGISASFDPNVPGPNYSALIDITNKNSIEVVVTDVFGNSSQRTVRLFRNQSISNKDNPMGLTWVVFIENSNYDSFNDLEGPEKDVKMIKSALQDYRVSNILHKRDMDKERLEKFFRIELRDMVNRYHVNSLVVWYAGHGAFMNGAGYWIPVDAIREDEFTYYDLNALRASMESYVEKLDHVMVFSDACESGPSFYLAMRGGSEDKSCDNWEQAKSKSAQVLSSAGYELAADNSLFATTIANMLTDNPNHCLAIDVIAEKVIKVIVDNNDQKPQFGNIKGFVHEGGTFFFVRR